MVYATGFSYKYENTLNLKVNDEVIFNKTEFNIEPINCTEKIFLTTNDNEILQIDNKTNKITAKKVGVCSLFAQIKCSATENLTAQININVTNETDDSDKIITTYNYTFYKDNNMATIEFSAGATKDENNIQITSGSDYISIESIEYNRITILLNAKGNAIIEIVCNTKKLILNIEIL